MNGWRSSLVLLALWGMDLSWLYGWAGVPMLAALGRPFPQIGAIAVSGLAVLATSFTLGRGWRNYRMAGSHLFGLLFACVAVLYVYTRPEQPCYQLTWLVDLFTQPKSPGAWLQLVFVVVWSVVFWLSGMRLALIPRDHNTISNHFDVGIIAFVLLHLLEVLLKVEGGIVLAELSLPQLFLSFFLFGVLAFCLARCQGEGKSGFLVGFRGIGVVLGFASLVLLLGSGLIAMFLPLLTSAATVGVAALQTIVAPAGDLMLKILTFFLAHGKTRPELPSGSARQETVLSSIFGPQPEGWLLLLQRAAVLLATGLVFLLFFTLLVLLVWQLVWWLGQKTGKTEIGPSPWRIVRRLLGRFVAALIRYVRFLSLLRSQAAGPVELFQILITWGSRSGLALLPSETPRQYGLRLAERFPAVQEDILNITTLHDKAVYGERIGLSEELKAASLSKKRLQSPRLWAIRLKSLLFQ